MKYTQLQNARYFLIGMSVLSVILTVASLFMSAWIALIGGIFLLATMGLWYWFYSLTFFKPKNDYYYIRINVNGTEELSYILKNIGYVLSHQYSDKLFSICILNKKQTLPILVSPSSMSSETLLSVLKDSKDFRKYEIHLDPIKSGIPPQLQGTYLYSHLNEKLIDKTTPKIHLFDVFHESPEITAVYLNYFYSKRYKDLLGNIVFVSSKSRKEIASSTEIIANKMPLVEEIDSAEDNPFNRILNSITKTLIIFQLGDAVVETAETIKFKPAENPFIQRTSPLNAFIEGGAEWAVAMSGEQLNSPVILMPRSLVLQDFPGLSNPTVIWASTLIKNQSSVIVVDFDGNVANSLKSLNSEDVMNDDLVIIKAPDKTPDRLINLISIWDGISDNYYFQILGLLLKSIEDFIRFSFEDLKKGEQDRLIAIMQGAILLIAIQKKTFDIASLITSMNEMTTPAIFLESIHKLLYTLVFESTEVDEINLAWATMNQLGTTVDYENTIAKQDPERFLKVNIEDLNKIKTKMTTFINDPVNIILSNGDSNHNLTDMKSLVFDLSEWANTQRQITFMPEYVITGALFIQSLKDFLGYPETHIIINGISKLSSPYQTRVINFLKAQLSKYNSIGNIIISDKSPLNGYASMFSNRLIEDVYLLRMNDLGSFRALLSSIQGVSESIFLLKKQNGYLLRTNPKTQKVAISNFYTAQPQIIEKVKQ